MDGLGKPLLATVEHLDMEFSAMENIQKIL